MFAIENLAPGLAMFGTVFMALFAGMLLFKDRTTSFLMRLFTSPMRAGDFISGYTLPLLALTLPQAAITFLAASLWDLNYHLPHSSHLSDEPLPFVLACLAAS